MTVPNSWILCHVREKEELRQQEKVLQFFHKLAKHNCYVASTLEVGTRVIWERFITKIPIDSDTNDEESFAWELQSGVSELAQQETCTYVAERQEQLTVEARLMVDTVLLRGFEFAITFVPADGTLLLSVNHERFFCRGQAGIMKFRYWVKLLQEIYAYWRPIFMYEFTHQGPPSINPDWEAVREFNIPALYTFNVFSPELVNKLGQEKLAQAPAWIIELLDDQGVLLIPTDVYGLTSEMSHAFDVVAKHLGFPVERNGVVLQIKS